MEYFVFRELVLPGLALLALSAVVFTWHRSIAFKVFAYLGTIFLMAIILLAMHGLFIYTDLPPKFKEQICMVSRICD